MSHPDDGMLAALLDGELTGDEQRTLEAHLRECEVCRARLAEEQAMMAEADGMVDALVPPPATREIQVPDRRAWWVRYRPLAWAATVVLAAGLGYYSGAWRGEPSRFPVPPAPAEADGASEGLRQEAGLRATPAPPPVANDRPSPSPASQRAAPVVQEDKEDEADAAAGRAVDSGQAETSSPPERVADVLSLQPGVAARAGQNQPGENPADSGAPLVALPIPGSRQPEVMHYRAAEPQPQAAGKESRARAARFSGATQEFAAPPATVAAPRGGFKPSSLEDAVKALGGSILLIDGLQPDQVEINSGPAPVVRIRYLFPSAGDTVFLEQERLDTSGIGSSGFDKAMQDNAIPYTPAAADSLKWVGNGFAFRLSGNVRDSLLKALVPRIH